MLGFLTAVVIVRIYFLKAQSSLTLAPKGKGESISTLANASPPKRY
jgi:hypothetical protein